MKNIILYRSMSGHSKKIATKMGLELGLEVFDIKNKPQIKDVDLAFIIGGIYSGKSLPDALEYFKNLNESNIKRAILITTSVTKKNNQDEIRDILTSNNVFVYEEEYHAFGNFLFIKLTHPNKQEIADAIIFSKKYLNTNE